MPTSPQSTSLQFRRSLAIAWHFLAISSHLCALCVFCGECLFAFATLCVTVFTGAFAVTLFLSVLSVFISGKVFFVDAAGLSGFTTTCPSKRRSTDCRLGN